MKFDDRDTPWMRRELIAAIKWKHRLYAKFVKKIQNESSRIIITAKNEYYFSLGRKLLSNVSGARSY